MISVALGFLEIYFMGLNVYLASVADLWRSWSMFWILSSFTLSFCFNSSSSCITCCAHSRNSLSFFRIPAKNCIKINTCCIKPLNFLWSFAEVYPLSRCNNNTGCRKNNNTAVLSSSRIPLLPP